jgi:hypothetical protein
VTPLRDGMNLVAKEYVAAQDAAPIPAFWCLSKFAGAAEEMEEALLVNPLDTQDVTFAIQRAITMPLEERIERHARPAGPHSQRAMWPPGARISSRCCGQPVTGRTDGVGGTFAWDRGHGGWSAIWAAPMCALPAPMGRMLSQALVRTSLRPCRL